MNFIDLSDENFQIWVGMALALWPDATKEDLEKEYQDQLNYREYRTYLAQSDDGEYTSFISLSLRSDYVEGSSSSPVGYVEGVYVKPEYRKQRIATALIQKAAAWAKAMGCEELASDTPLSNIDSQHFHKRAGFEHADTIVHFIKRI